MYLRASLSPFIDRSLARVCVDFECAIAFSATTFFSATGPPWLPFLSRFSSSRLFHAIGQQRAMRENSLLKSETIETERTVWSGASIDEKKKRWAINQMATDAAIGIVLPSSPRLSLSRRDGLGLNALEYPLKASSTITSANKYSGICRNYPRRK